MVKEGAYMPAMLPLFPYVLGVLPTPSLTPRLALLGARRGRGDGMRNGFN